MSEYKVFEMGDIDEMVAFLKSGGVLAYPSESVWGLGCDAFHVGAIERIFTLKTRPEHKGLIVLTDAVNKVAPLLVDLNESEQNQILQRMQKQYDDFDTLQGQARTWVVPVATSAHLPNILTGGFDNLAVRVTHHHDLQQLCQALTDDSNPYGFLVSTSCNISGEPAATTLAQAKAYFGNQVGYLNAKSLGFTKPSQIIDVLTNEILR